MGFPATSSSMVGRRTELALLLDAFDAGAAGHPQAVLIQGEAGIGKTRLVQEFLATVATRAAGDRSAITTVVATAHCVDLGPIGAPLLPVRRLLRDVLAAVGEEDFRGAAGSAAVTATLSTVLPELAPAEPHPAADGDHIAEAIERIIEGLSETRHLLLIVEDLHWADAATLALLKTLAVTLRGSHVTWVCSYRTDDVRRGHPLRAVLAELSRSRVVTSMSLARLSPEEVAEQTRHITGSALDPAALQAVIARSEGVPFFVEELLELRGAPLPSTLRHVVLARYERLTARTRDLVGLIAVGGVHVDHELLASVSDVEPAELRTGLHEALTESILVAEGGGYSFRHALIQEAVHDELLPGERVDWHAAYARALQPRIDDGDTSAACAAAAHWMAARDLPRAFDATALARTSLAGTSPATTVLLGERLLELWTQVPDAESRSGENRGALALAMAGEYLDLGEHDRSRRVAEAGLNYADTGTLLQARLLGVVAARLRSMNRMAESVRAAEAARGLLGTPARSEEQALLATISSKWALSADIENRAEVLDDAVALAERSGDGDALATVLGMRAWFRGDDCGEPAAALVDLSRAAALPASVATHYTIVNNLVDTLGRLGRYREALEIGGRALQETVDLGRERGLGSFLLANVAELELHLGAFAAGLPRAERCLRVPTDSVYFRSFALGVLSEAYLWHDEAERSQAIIDRAATVVALLHDAPEDAIFWAGVEADSALRDFEETCDARPLDAVARLVADQLRDQHIGLTTRLLPQAARLAVHAPEGGDELRTAVERLARDHPASPQRSGILAIAAAEFSRSVDGWHAAVERAIECQLPVRSLHLARYRLAEALVAAGEREQAMAVLAQLSAEAPGHGITLVARWARELAERAGFADAGSPGGRGAGRGARAVSGLAALTPRELQVLQLVAEGLSNPQIGARLYIAPKTASVHVSAILAKIGAANRAEAAAVFTAAQPG